MRNQNTRSSKVIPTPAMRSMMVALAAMLVGSAAVVRSLLAGRKVRRACLGTVADLPMSTVALVEDGLMAAMAATMLLFR